MARIIVKNQALHVKIRYQPVVYAIDLYAKSKDIGF
jgi:hypothetical protein